MRILISALTLLFVSTVAAAGTLSGPIIDEGLRLEVEDLVQLPASFLGSPLTRINFVREAPDESGRLFVNDLRGTLYLIQGSAVSTYLDVSNEVPLKTAPNIGTGFASFAFHPAFSENGLIYTVHTEVVGTEPANLGPALPAVINQHSVLSEWNATDPAASVFNGSRRELIRIAAISTNHNMGEIAFNSSAKPGDRDYGNLYIGAGDYGSVALDDPEQLQRIDTPYGAILRIDPLGGPFERDGTAYPYGIPSDNPFVDEPGALAEVFAYGFRNAHRLSWGKRGKLYVSDIGQSNIEEVNRVEAGDNFGWPNREGTFAINVETAPGVVLPLPAVDERPYRYPVAQYDHEEGRAIAGGFEYNGDAIPELRGKFVFGDLVNGRIFYTDKENLWKADHDAADATAPTFELRLLRNGVPTSLQQLVNQATGRFLLRTDLRFARDANGELLITTKQDGFVRRLQRDTRPDCDDGYDDDGDGFRDYPDDPGCFDAMGSTERPQCQDGKNNDRKLGTDFDGGASALGADMADPRGADPECDGKPWHDRETAPRKFKKKKAKKAN